MTKTIIAMGGGYFGEHRDTYVHAKPENGAVYFPVETTPIDELIIRSSGKENPSVLLITTPSEDGQHDVDLYVEAFKKQYEVLGASIEVLRLIQEEPAQADIESKILAADVIYVSGGNTHLMIETWQRLGVDKLLRKAYESGTTMSGLSAGAVAWFSDVTSNSFYTNKPIRVKGLGWLSALICPHYDSEPFRQESFKQMLKDTPELVGLALDEHAAIEIVDDKFRVHSFGSGGSVRRCYWKNGDYVVENVEKANEPKSISNLIYL